MEKRKKRRLAIIIVGLDVPVGGDLAGAFDPVARQLTGGPVPLSEVVCIDQAKKVYRAKVGSDAVKKKLLDNAPSLAQSNYRHIYVNRDLTYVQRQELKRRRQSRRSAQPTASAQMTAPVSNSDDGQNLN